MSDIEDQLLELAGGDESSDDEQAMDMSREDSRSPSPPPQKDKRDTPARNTPTKKTPAKKASKRARSDDESEDEGQASSVPSSPSSQQSVPMDESDSDDESVQNKSRGEDEGNQYPVEGLFRDYEEKEQIMSMREIEREQILAERREENERIRQNRILRQLKVNQDKDNKKRKASAADLEDAQRKPSRVRTKAGETSDKMDSLRRAREERSSRKEQRERENDRRKQRSPSYSRRSMGRDDESDIEWDRPTKRRSRTPEIKESPPAELRDIERARVGRSRFGIVAYTPGFEQALTGCFVRVNIGPHPETRQEVYRMGVIKGFNQGKAYAMPSSATSQIVVETYARVAHGKSEKEWPLIFCSDGAFTESEYNRYKAVCASEKVPFPTKDTMKKKIDDINKLLDHAWTEAELSEKFKKQNALRAKYSGFERDDLMRQIEAALRKDNKELAEKLQAKLDNLETPKLAFRTSLTPQKKDMPKPPSQQERLAQLNAQNRKINAEEIRKAQHLERQKARENDRLERAKSKAGTPAPSDTPASTPNSKAPLHIAKLKQQQRADTNTLPIIHAPITKDDIIADMDLDIDIEI
ncbi:hypothetical protein V8F06_003280 [Rhypophila decipiens]